MLLLGILVGVKAVEVLFLLIATTLIAVASGVCNYYAADDGYICEYGGYKLSIDNWDHGMVSFSHTKVQFFVFVSSVILTLCSMGMTVGALGVVICAVNGALEAWFTAGFGTDVFGLYGGFVRSWAAATVFYFLALFCYIADLILTKHWYKKVNW